MTAIQHTPGPWRFRKCPCRDPVCTRYRITIADSSGMFSIDDAVLIVAAPDMLAALREIEAHVAEPEFTLLARAAIAKATQL